MTNRDNIDLKRVGILMWQAVSDTTSVMTFALKFVRIIFVLLVLRLVSSMFKDWYVDASTGRLPGPRPSMRTFVAYFFMIDFFVNLTISLATVRLVGHTVTRTSMVDYIIGNLISLKFSLSTATALANERFFDYDTDGIALITTLEHLMTVYIIVNTFIPYYLLVRHIIYI
jgi:hypothetical protein